MTGTNLRRLVICFDGTWENGDSTSPTNVVRLYNCLKHDDQQSRLYIEGIGADDAWFLHKVFIGGLGTGLSANIRRAYEWICEECADHPADMPEIHLIGFSRGACTARAVARLLNDIGIVCYNTLLKKWLDIWSEWINRSKQKSLDGNFWHNLGLHNNVRYRTMEVKVCAAFDTVSALYGFQGHGLSFLQDAVVGDNIENAIQALALHERRSLYSPDVWQQRSIGQRPNLKQCWFLGHHSDVGGGEVGASNVSLAWMITKIEQCSSVEFEDGEIHAALSNSGGLLREGIFVLKEPVTLAYSDRTPGRDSSEHIHWSVGNFLSQYLCHRKHPVLHTYDLLHTFPGNDLPTQKIQSREIKLLREWIHEETIQGEPQWLLTTHRSPRPGQPTSSFRQGASGSLALSGSENPSSPRAYEHLTQANATYSHPTSGTQPYASSQYDTTRATQQATYRMAPASVPTQANNYYQQYVQPRGKTYSDVKNNMTWTFGEGERSLHTIDPVTGESLVAYYYDREDLKTWAFYRQNGEFVRFS